MHISSLTNIHDVLILYESTEYLKESRHVKKFRWYIEVCILCAWLFISNEVVVEPLFAISGNLSRKSTLIFFFLSKVDNSIVTTDLILRDNLHDHILVDVVSFIVKYNSHSQKV